MPYLIILMQTYSIDNYNLDNINNYQAICGTCNKWKTYSFDHYLRNYLKNNSQNIILDDILKLQNQEYIKFNGPYQCTF